MRRPWSALIALALLAAGVPAWAASGPGDSAAGAQAFLPCSACHSVAPDGAVFVSNSHDHNVYKFSPEGALVKTFNLNTQTRHHAGQIAATGAGLRH